MRPAIARDPVCHMEIERERAAAERRRGAAVLSFCSVGCAELFDRTPEDYLSSAPAERDEYHVVVIGGGPAGLTAAVYASILRLTALLIADNVGGQAVESVDMENYMGFQVIEGRDLVARFRDQLLHSHFIDHRLDRATLLTANSGRFQIGTERGGRYSSEAVILATGMKQRTLGVPGEQELLHRGVSFSVVQDTERFYGHDVAVVGGGNFGLQAATRLATVARAVFLIAVRALSGDAVDIARARTVRNLTILEHTAVGEILGRERVEGIRVNPPAGGDPRVIPVTGVFVEIGFTPDSAVAGDLVEVNPRGEIVIGSDCSTRTPGLFAAGDVSTGYGKRVIITCGEGAKAALAAHDRLISQ
jgi:alkyl hydroperoxide reductase subunit F